MTDIWHRIFRKPIESRGFVLALGALLAEDVQVALERLEAAIEADDQLPEPQESVTSHNRINSGSFGGRFLVVLYVVFWPNLPVHANPSLWAFPGYERQDSDQIQT